MPISEGLLPPHGCISRVMVPLPFAAYGIFRLNSPVKEYRNTLPLPVVAGASIFVPLSLVKPSVTGRCSYPTGAWAGTTIVDPGIMAMSRGLVPDECNYPVKGQPSGW